MTNHNREQDRDQQQKPQQQKPQHDPKQREQGRDPREMTKVPDRDMDKNRNEEETGKPVSLGKDKKPEGEGRGPQLP
jgi:hypothetical protein